MHTELVHSFYYMVMGYFVDTSEPQFPLLRSEEFLLNDLLGSIPLWLSLWGGGRKGGEDGWLLYREGGGEQLGEHTAGQGGAGCAKIHLTPRFSKETVNRLTPPQLHRGKKAVGMKWGRDPYKGVMNSWNGSSGRAPAEQVGKKE
jgi:hypothetical protein